MVRMHKEGPLKMKKFTPKAAGIDTGKDKLDVAIHGSQESLVVANDTAGHEQLIDWLLARKITRVGIEASGGYEKAVLAALRLSGLSVILFQPKQVRCFAGFQLQRAKNDRIDASLIARCAAFWQQVRQAPDARLQDFAEPLTLIDQLNEDLARWKTRLEGFRQADQRRWAETEIRRLKRIIEHERVRLIKAVKSHKDLARRFSLIESVQGIGAPTALTLLIRMPELGSLSREKIAALAGLAPFDHDSGRFKGQRRIAGGRKRARQALYAAALPAAFRWNPLLVVLYKRLIEGKKSHKQALVACARKLLIMANAVVARGTPWVNHQIAT